MTQEREKDIEVGRESVEKELRRWKIDLNRVEKDGQILKIAQEFNFKTELELYVAIGHGRQSAKIIVTRLVPLSERETAKDYIHRRKAQDTQAPKRKKRGESSGAFRHVGSFREMLQSSTWRPDTRFYNKRSGRDDSQDGLRKSS